MPEFRLYEELAALTAELDARRARGQVVGLVPTMGNLHAGHLALVADALRHCDFVLATIFINPLQFGPGEDLARYPRTFQADLAALEQAGCHAVFAPDAHTMYPDGMEPHTRITVPRVSALHCGQSRPGHFDGVCTVVCKLFNMTRPAQAFFGLKDYQQFHIIGRMVRDLHLPVTLHGLPTVRDSSGLALSSRNAYLSATEHRQAAALYATLQRTATAIKQGAADFRRLEAQAATELAQAGLLPDYVHICNSDTLEQASPGDWNLVILAAASAGSTRLIDNILVPRAT
jgi:pantoate--beta-alanine ligase